MTRDKWCEKFGDQLEKIGISLHCEEDEDTIYVDGLFKECRNA